MVKGVHIENFRSFKELTVENLASLNIVVGKNNTGKSSFLEAVFMALDAVPIVPSRSVYAYILERRGMEVGLFSFYPMEHLQELLEFLRIHFFYRAAEKAKIQLKLDNKTISREFEFRIHDSISLNGQNSGVFEFASLMDNGYPVMGIFVNLDGKFAILVLTKSGLQIRRI